jgi:hypothetical protein
MMILSLMLNVFPHNATKRVFFSSKGSVDSKLLPRNFGGQKSLLLSKFFYVSFV